MRGVRRGISDSVGRGATIALLSRVDSNAPAGPTGSVGSVRYRGEDVVGEWNVLLRRLERFFIGIAKAPRAAFAVGDSRMCCARGAHRVLRARRCPGPDRNATGKWGRDDATFVTVAPATGGSGSLVTRAAACPAPARLSRPSASAATSPCSANSPPLGSVVVRVRLGALQKICAGAGPRARLGWRSCRNCRVPRQLVRRDDAAIPDPTAQVALDHG
jgi:hypothetical protein